VPVVAGAEPLEIIKDGATTAVLLCHGFTGSPASMKPWAQFLAEAGYSVSVPRLPGHGTKWQDANLTRWQDWYDTVERAFEKLAATHEQVFVMGLSMGGTLTIALAERKGSQVAGLVLVNPSVLTERKDAKLLPILSKIVPSFPGISNDIKKPDQDEVAYNKIPLKAAASLSELWTLVRADIAKIDQPVLLLRSAVDHVVEPSNAVFILDGISSADKREIVLENSYHVATLDNDAQIIFDESLAFVRAHSGNG
jgi:carboxylesterase